MLPFSTKTLLRISVYVAIGGLTSAIIMRQLLIDKVRRQEYFQTAMRDLRAHQGAINILGEPIKEVGIDIGNPNYAEKMKAYFEVKVAGPKDVGTLYIWADRPNETDQWNVPRLELQLRNDDEKRLLIKKDSDSSGNLK